jgi:ASCH domain
MHPREIRGLTVRRPWANLIVAGHKTTENRGWATRHRGFLVIHAGRKWEPSGAALAAELGFAGFGQANECPTGFVGVVQLVDVHRADGCCEPWGSPGPNVYHWVLTDARRLPHPVAARGKQGLFTVPAEVGVGAE